MKTKDNPKTWDDVDWNKVDKIETNKNKYDGRAEVVDNKSLSEKEWDVTISGYNGTKYHKGFLKEDVKESIRLLKKETKYFDGWSSVNDSKEFREIINKIFGRKLI